MNVRMMPPQGPMGQPMPMGGAPAPMPPQGGPMMPPAPTTPQSQQGKGLGSAFGGSVQGRQGFKQFMTAKKQTSAMVPQVAQSQMPRPSPVQAPQPMLPAPSPQMMGAIRPMGGGQASMPVQAGRPMRGTQGGLGSAPVQLNRGGVVDMAPADGQLGLFVGGQRQDSVPGVYQKMLRAGLPRDEAFGEIESLRDSAMHVAEDLGKFLETPHAGFEHSHGDFRAAGFAEGGEVEIPRETEIMGVPHYLAYIQPEEGDILEDLGGLGEPIGPGGIPTYIIHKGWSESSFNPSNWGGGGGGGGGGGRDFDADMSVGAINTGGTYSGSDSIVSGGFDFDDDDDNNNSSSVTVSTGSSGYPSLDATAGINTSHTPGSTLIDVSGANIDWDAYNKSLGIDTSYATSSAWEPPGFDFDNDGISGEGSDVLDNNVDSPFVDIDDDPVTPVTPTYDPSDYDYGSDSDETDFSQPVVSTPVVDTTPAPKPKPAPVYYDMFGGQHSTQAAADAADAKYTAEAVAAEAVETVTSTPSDTTYSYTGTDTDAGSDTDPASVYESSIFREASVPLPGGAGPTSEDIMPGITGTEAGVGAGERTEAEENALRALYNMDPIGVDADEDDDLKTAVEDIYNIGLEGEFGGLDLDVPEAEADVGLQKASAEFPDYSDDDLGLPDFPVDLPDDDVESAEDFRRTEAGLSGIDYETGQREGGEADEDETKDALMEVVKERVSEVEGTSDEGGYDRLLGNQEGNFGVKPSQMTVAEILDFQKQRGEGSYAEYAKDTVGRISTPVGKYQVVGTTLQGLVDKGIVDENEMFDAATQERIGSYLIQSRGLFDENITDEQFIENLGNEFEGIERFGYDGGTEGVDQRQESIQAVSQKVSDDDLSTIKEQLSEAIDPTLTEMGLALGAELLIPGFGGMIAEQIRTAGPAERQAIIDSHVRALEAGATPLYDDDGNYTGFDRSTMGTFADAVLAADDVGAFLPPSMEGGTFTVTQDDIDSLRDAGLGDRADELTVGQELSLPEFTNDSYLADADQDGQLDIERFEDVFGAQQTAADADPYGMSTEDGFILTGEDGLAGTEDDREFFVLDDGNVVEVRGDGEDDDKDIVDLDLTPDDVNEVIENIIGGDDGTEGGDDSTQQSNPCPDGYSLVDGMCQPDDGVGTPEGDAEAARITLRLRDISRGGGDTTGTTPTPVEGEALTIRAPAQFNEGGGVYGPDSEDDDVDRYYRSSGDQGYIVSDYGPGYSTYQLGEGEDPAGLMNYLDNQQEYQVYKASAPADSMDDGSAFLGMSSPRGITPINPGGEGVTVGGINTPIVLPESDEIEELIAMDRPGHSRENDTGLEGLPAPRPVEPMIIRAPAQFAMGGPVDLDPNTYDFRGFDEDNPFSMGHVNRMMKHHVGLRDLDEDQMRLYDFNRDGTVDISDSTAGLSYLNYMSEDGVFDEAKANENDFYLYTPPTRLGARPVRGQSAANPVQQPVQQPVQGMAVRAPKQFAQGGMVTPNIDRFLQSLGA